VRTGAVSLALQALDGTKIEAAASSPTGWSKESMEKLLAQLDAALDQIELKVVEENADVAAPGYRLPAGLAQRQALRDEIKKGLAQLEADGRQHYHPVEPEARRMKVGQTNRFAYNAQAVADAQDDAIVACEASVCHLPRFPPLTPRPIPDRFQTDSLHIISTRAGAKNSALAR
jgi:hypothetical protein